VDGPIVVDGMLFIHSGYGLFNQMPGNVLLAYSIE
jgi:polyvinyl alcohol dehydrogenase (cytochrome)